MPDDLEDTMLFRRFKAVPSVPDPLVDKIQTQAVFDEVLSQHGMRAPAPEPNEGDGHYLARLGECCAVFGPEERKRIDRTQLPAAALAAFVQEDLAIARQEAERPFHTLREGVLTERRRPDQSGREIIEFYSKSGPSVWMDTFKDPVISYVACGSKGFATPDNPPSNRYSFNRSQTNPELVALQERAAYMDSAEYKVAQAYRAVGLEPPENVLQQFKARVT